MKIQVTQAVRQYALARLLMDFKLRPGGRVFYRELSACWRLDTGLRQSDLHQALAELVEIGGLRLCEGAEGQLVELTSDGARALDASGIGFVGLASRLHAMWVLARSQRRIRRAQQAPVPSVPRRRAGDPWLEA